MREGGLEPRLADLQAGAIQDNPRLLLTPILSDRRFVDERREPRTERCLIVELVPFFRVNEAIGVKILPSQVARLVDAGKGRATEKTSKAAYALFGNGGQPPACKLQALAHGDVSSYEA